MFIWMIYTFCDSFNGFYQFNNFEIQSIYVTGSWSNQLLNPTRLCNRSWSNLVHLSGQIRF